MAFDGLERHVQLVGDLAVGTALGHQPHHAELARGQRFQAAAPDTSGAGAGGPELITCAGGERASATAGGEVERLGERFACSGAPAVPAQRCPEL